MSRKILAIDIRSNDRISALLLNAGLKVHTIESSAAVSLPQPSESDTPLADTLRLLFEKIDPTSANVLVALPPDGTIYRNIAIPFKEDGKIRQVLPFELEPLLPIGVDKLNIGYHINSISDQSDVLAVAIDQTHLQNYMDTLGGLNIRPQLVVPGGFALAEYFSRLENFASDHLLVMEADQDKTNLIAIMNGKIELIRLLSSRLGDEQGAEALALRIRQTLTALSDRKNEAFIPTKVYATGPGIETLETLNWIESELEVSVESVDLFQHAPRLELYDSDDWHPPSMMSALALALLEAEGSSCANFHRIHSPLRNFWNSYRPYIMGPACLLSAALIIGLTGVMIDNYLLNKKVDRLNRQMEKVFLSAFPGSKIKGDPLEHMESKIKEIQKGDRTAGMNPNQARAIDVLLQVSQLVPAKTEVLLTQMTMGSGSVTLSGETTNFNSVDDLKSSIEKGDLFKQVTIASANTDKSGNKVRFKLKIDL